MLSEMFDEDGRMTRSTKQFAFEARRSCRHAGRALNQLRAHSLGELSRACRRDRAEFAAKLDCGRSGRKLYWLEFAMEILPKKLLSVRS